MSSRIWVKLRKNVISESVGSLERLGLGWAKPSPSESRDSRDLSYIIIIPQDREIECSTELLSIPPAGRHGFLAIQVIPPPSPQNVFSWGSKEILLALEIPVRRFDRSFIDKYRHIKRESYPYAAHMPEWSAMDTGQLCRVVCVTLCTGLPVDGGSRWYILYILWLIPLQKWLKTWMIWIQICLLAFWEIVHDRRIPLASEGTCNSVV